MNIKNPEHRVTILRTNPGSFLVKGPQYRDRDQETYEAYASEEAAVRAREDWINWLQD